MAKNVSSKFDLDSGLFREAKEEKVQQLTNEVLQWDISNDPAEFTRVKWGEELHPLTREMLQPWDVPDDLSALYSPSDVNKPRPLGCTQGRKGQKAKRINMAFGDEIHAYITHESKRRGMNATQFVNMVLAMYKDSPEGKID